MSNDGPNVRFCHEELLKIFQAVRTPSIGQDRNKAPISWSDNFCLGGQPRRERTQHTLFIFKYCLQSPPHQLITSHGDSDQSCLSFIGLTHCICSLGREGREARQVCAPRPTEGDWETERLSPAVQWAVRGEREREREREVYRAQSTCHISDNHLALVPGRQDGFYHPVKVVCLSLEMLSSEEKCDNYHQAAPGPRARLAVSNGRGFYSGLIYWDCRVATDILEQLG